MNYLVGALAGLCIVALAIYSETHPNRPSAGHWVTHILAWIVGLTQAVIILLIAGVPIP